MTTQTKPSKNKRRKRERAPFYDVMKALGHNPDDPQAQQALRDLKERYFGIVDGRLDRIGAYCDEDTPIDEWRFIRDCVRPNDTRNGWATIRTSDGATVRVKTSLFEYIDARQAVDQGNRGPKSSVQRAAAAQYLVEKGFATSTGPRHT